MWVLGLMACLDGVGEKDLAEDTSGYQTTTINEGPSCSDCQLLVAEIAECEHQPYLEDEGNPCGDGYCIYSELNTYTCVKNPEATGPHTCNAGLVGTDAVTQQLRLSDYCDGTRIVEWGLFHEIFAACPDDTTCTRYPWSTACELPNLAECGETSAYPLFYQGERFACDICE